MRASGQGDILSDPLYDRHVRYTAYVERITDGLVSGHSEAEQNDADAWCAVQVHLNSIEHA